MAQKKSTNRIKTKKTASSCPHERNSYSNKSKGKNLFTLPRAERSRIAKRGSNSRPQHWQAMLIPYLFGARLCSTNWAISAFCSTHSAHFWLRSLHESKLPHLRTKNSTKHTQTKKDSKLLSSWAENEARTRDPNLGKVVLYQLSYFRICYVYWF